MLFCSIPTSFVIIIINFVSSRKFLWLLNVLLPVELFGALRGRLYDSNKNIVMATLTTIGNVASAMGQAVEKSSKVGVFFLVSLFVSSNIRLLCLKSGFSEMVCCRVFCQMF